MEDNSTWRLYERIELMPHRETTIAATYETESLIYVNDIDVVILKRSDSGDWWIAPADYEFDDEMEDIGPFETEQDAAIHLKLIADPL